MRVHEMEGEIYTFAFTDNDCHLHSSVDDLTIQRDSLESQPWFHGKIDRAEAEKRVQRNGVFLVRESITKDGGFVVTTKWNGKHLNVLIKTVHDPATHQISYMFDLTYTFPTVSDLINYYVDNQLPFAGEKSEAALYRPAAIPTLNSTSEPPRNMSMFEAPVTGTNKERLWDRMHRFGSEVTLNNNVVGRGTKPSRFTDLRSFDKEAYKVRSLFDLDKTEIREDEEAPRQSRRRNTELAMCSEVPLIPDNNGFVSPDSKRNSAKKNLTISKGRYLEMVDKVKVPIHNLDVWDESSPPTPTNTNHSSSPSSLRAISGSSSQSTLPTTAVSAQEDSVYMDMNTLGKGEPPPPLPPLQPEFEGDFDVYGLTLTPTPDSTQKHPPLNARIANWAAASSSVEGDGVAVWQKQIESASINWNLTSHVKHLAYEARGVQKPLEAAIWQRIRVALLRKQPLFLAEQLVLENAQFLLLNRWTASGIMVPGIKHGFHLVLLPDAKEFRAEIQERYFVLSRFIIASLVTEMDSANRLKLLKFWLQVGDALLTTYRDYFCLHALLNAIFSIQVSKLSDTLSSLFQSTHDGVSSLYQELHSVHKEGSVARTSLATCVPDLGRFVQLYSSEPSTSSTEQEEELYLPVGLTHLLADLDAQMLALLSARSWQSFQGRLWIEDITAGKEPVPYWSELLRVETLMSLLWGPNDFDPVSKQQLHSKLDRALTMFAERTQLLEA